MEPRPFRQSKRQNPPSTIWSVKHSIALATAVVAVALAATGFAITTSADGEDGQPLRASMSAFSGQLPREARRRVPDKARLLGERLGAFDSALRGWLSADGAGVCYALVGESERDPAASYCWHPQVVPGALHFNAMALESALEGDLHVQLFGVAFDDVEALRARVEGSWLGVPIANNAFYLDLPGVRHRSVELLAGTLSDGTRQFWNVQTALPQQEPMPRMAD